MCHAAGPVGKVFPRGTPGGSVAEKVGDPTWGSSSLALETRVSLKVTHVRLGLRLLKVTRNGSGRGTDLPHRWAHSGWDGGDTAAGCSRQAKGLEPRACPRIYVTAAPFAAEPALFVPVWTRVTQVDPAQHQPASPCPTFHPRARPGLLVASRASHHGAGPGARQPPQGSGSYPYNS